MSTVAERFFAGLGVYSSLMTRLLVSAGSSAFAFLADRLLNCIGSKSS